MKKESFMKFILLALLMTTSVFASENDLYNGASAVKPVHHELQVSEHNGMFNASSDVRQYHRNMASEKKEKKEISMGHDSYFTGTSN
jgi:hypothetical protein